MRKYRISDLQFIPYSTAQRDFKKVFKSLEKKPVVLTQKSKPVAVLHSPNAVPYALSFPMFFDDRVKEDYIPRRREECDAARKTKTLNSKPNITQNAGFMSDMGYSFHMKPEELNNMIDEGIFE